MNREILFRGKRVDNGEWVEGFYCEFPCNDGTDIPSIMRIENHSIFIQYPIISETRGMYTGLTDKNGRRIFEGDIIEYQGKRYSINYLKHYARFSAVKPNTVFCVFAYQMGEVIGNIHDNLELLGGGDDND